VYAPRIFGLELPLSIHGEFMGFLNDDMPYKLLFNLLTHSGWPQSRRKKFPEFSRLFQSHKITFPQVIATKCKM